MSKQTQKVGSLEILKAKAVLGLPVDARDVVLLSEIVNHNAARLTELANKVDALSEQTNLRFQTFNESLDTQQNALLQLGDGLERAVDAIAELHESDGEDVDVVVTGTIDENGDFDLTVESDEDVSEEELDEIIDETIDALDELTSGQVGETTINFEEGVDELVSQLIDGINLPAGTTVNVYKL